MDGIAVHIGARVAAVAIPGEVPVSSTVKDLIAGSGLQLQEREMFMLKGVPSKWRLFAVKHGGPCVSPKTSFARAGHAGGGSLVLLHVDGRQKWLETHVGD